MKRDVRKEVFCYLRDRGQASVRVIAKAVGASRAEVKAALANMEALIERLPGHTTWIPADVADAIIKKQPKIRAVRRRKAARVTADGPNSIEVQSEVRRM